MRIKTRRLFDFSALLAAIVMMAAGASWAAPIDTPAGNAFMVDYATGAVLLDKNADEPMPPASMSKLMTVYMVFERLRNGGLSLDDTFQVSEKAWRMGGSKMFVLVDTRVSVEDLLRGIIVQSGNDACIVVAEAMGGSEAGFADQMNERAAELGMTTSHFTNATGWPDPGHYMSARDLAFLARRIISEFPEYYTYFAETNFAYNDISQPNRNPLLFQCWRRWPQDRPHRGIRLRACVIRRTQRPPDYPGGQWPRQHQRAGSGITALARLGLPRVQQLRPVHIGRSGQGRRGLAWASRNRSPDIAPRH